MPLTVTKGDGVTVLTISSNSGSNIPLVLQLLGSLCCSPVCYVSQGLRKLLAGTQTALGTVQIMVGLFNIGLGAVLVNGSDTFLRWSNAPFWLGGVFIAAGIMSMLGERFPSPCLVVFTAFVNFASACLAVTAIVLYSVDLAQGQGIRWMCQSYEDAIDRSDRYYYRRTTTTSPETLQKRRTNFEICMSTRNILVVLLGGIEILLILFAVLQLCVTITATVLGLKALCKNRTEEKPKPDPELYKPLVEEVATSPTV